jgi:hypothetical protein
MTPYVTFNATNRAASQLAFSQRGFPDVALVGFIPHSREIPAGSDYLKYTGLKRAGMKYLLRTGNYAPDEADVGSREDLVRYLCARAEYRGALLVSNLRLGYQRDGTPVFVSFEGLDEDVGVGYTLAQRLSRPHPLLRPPRPGSQQWMKRAIVPMQGVSRPDDERWAVAFGQQCVVISHWQCFRIGGVGNLASAFFTHQFAPFAWVHLEYTVCSDGQRSAEATSSYIPSVMSFGDWKVVDVTDMITNNFSDIDAFMTTRKDTPAPARPSWKVL